MRLSLVISEYCEICKLQTEAAVNPVPVLCMITMTYPCGHQMQAEELTAGGRKPCNWDNRLHTHKLYTRNRSIPEVLDIWRYKTCCQARLLLPLMVQFGQCQNSRKTPLKSMSQIFKINPNPSKLI